MNQLPRQEMLAAVAKAHGTSLLEPDREDVPGGSQRSRGPGNAADENTLTLDLVWLRVRCRAAADLQDRDVTARVTRALQKEPELKSLGVCAKSLRGVVELRGSVTDDRLARRAALVAANVPGAVAVCEHLKVASRARHAGP